MELFKVFGTLALRGADVVNRGMREFERLGQLAADRLNRLSDLANKVGGDLTKYLTGPVLVLVAGLARLGTQFVRRTREITDFAAAANTDAQTIQRYGFAARRVGVEMGEVAQIVGTLNREASAFASTGGGALTDFFENIAPRVGLSARNFARLSGPEALVAYYRALERANISQAEMNRYLEALGPNAARLAPLLANGGAELRRLGDEAERTGAIMDDSVIQAGLRLEQRQRELGERFSRLSDQLSERLIPVFERLADIVEQRVVPVIERIAESAGRAIEWFTSLSAETQESIIKWVALAAALGPVILVFGGVVRILALMIRSTALLARAGLTLVRWGATALAAGRTAAAGIATATTAAARAPGIIGTAAAALGRGIAVVASSTVSVFATAGRAVAQGASALASGAGRAVAAVGGAVARGAASLAGMLARGAAAAVSGFAGIIARIGTTILGLIPVIARFILRFTPIGAAFTAGYLAGQLLVDLFRALWPWLTGIGDAVVEGFRAIPGAVGVVLGWFQRLYDGGTDLVGRLASAVGTMIGSMVRSVVDGISNMVNRALDGLRRLYREAVGNSIIPDLARDVVGEIEGMADGAIAGTRRMTREMLAGMPREGLEVATAPVVRRREGMAEGSGTYVDLRHSIIRDDRDMLERMRRQGPNMLGVF